MNNPWSVLFNPDEGICMSKTPYGTSLYAFEDAIKINRSHQFFSINPLDQRRLDANVTAFRNVLLEFDNLSKEAQWAIVETVPKSVVTWSGSKSWHCIISLESPCTSRAEYDALVRRILAKVPDADPSCRNPSRFSRTPEAIRDNGCRQVLAFVGTRVSTDTLEAWLGPAPEIVRPATRLPQRLKILSGFTQLFLMEGAAPGKWNSTLFSSVCELTRAGYDYDAIIEMCVSITGTLDSRDLSTIKSAVRTAERDLTSEE